MWIMLQDMTEEQLVNELQIATRWLLNARMEVLTAQGRCDEIDRVLQEKFNVSG